MTAETFEILSNSEVIAVNQGKETFYFMKKNKKKRKKETFCTSPELHILSLCMFIIN